MNAVKPGLLLRLEAGIVLAGCLIIYGVQHFSWVVFAILFLAPDLSIVAYKVNVPFGARVYNLVHTYVGPAILMAVGFTLAQSMLPAYALIWAAHIAFDRLLGFGLKYPTNFKDTHLQRL